jgi:hypothetical protein
VNRRERKADAAAAIRECRVALAARGSSVIHEAIGGEAAGGKTADIVDWHHYPDGEVYDPATHVQYFYHRHRAPSDIRQEWPGECGHFHLFVRGEGIPAGISPMLFAENAVANAPLPPQSAPLKHGRREEVCHLVAIAVDCGGEPIGLFTTNRWVTGETAYRADDAIRLIHRIRFDRGKPVAPIDRWIEALTQLFEPEIAVLLRRRDKAILDWRWRWPRSNVFEDRRLEITSSCAIDLEARLAFVEMQAVAPAAIPPTWRRDPLPSVADGWGR